jgi:hypothetical protein
MISEKRLKQLAKLLKKNLGITHAQALEQVAKDQGFTSWQKIVDHFKTQEIAAIAAPAVSTDFAETGEIELEDADYVLLETERIADLPFAVKQRVRANVVVLTRLGIEFSIFEPTKTGLGKSILDATQPVRDHFQLIGFHSYTTQIQGEIRRTPSYFVQEDEVRESVGSFYRPKTKFGDPRMWFKNLGKFANAGDQVAIVIYKDIPHLLNLSVCDLEAQINNSTGAIAIFFQKYTEFRYGRAKDLLAKLRELAQSPIKALRSGDTGIGYTIETMLGIAANSSKQPDYFGIEIKTGRSSKTRTTLFAQVPDWTLSPCGQKTNVFEKGSSAKILQRYGYQRGDDQKLYCTISTQKKNSQGLYFYYNAAKDQLEERDEEDVLVAVWPDSTLRARLHEKHAETFWVNAKSLKLSDGEYFQLIDVVHTKSPILSQLISLIINGQVTMDHLIKKTGSDGKVTEKGPLFKINKRDLELLFPPPVIYSLKE